ncbi:NAD(P)H-binding protein [Paenibacillus sp. TRM 82003]|nr:NAD(P)H-binding protein [Paenibacillus sp. TRM 82003]
MKVLIFGATGMVGQSALRECAADGRVAEVLSIGRRRLGQPHEKVREIVLEEVADLSSVEGELAGYDACFFCLGVSSAGMKEADYSRMTYDLTLSVAETLARANPRMTFIYVSGMGTDSTERGRSMWARVKGRTENALLRLPFRAAYMLRPGVILPVHGVRSKTKLYQAMYEVLRPLYPWLRKMNSVITSEQLGRAMIELAVNGYASPVLEGADLKRIGSRRDNDDAYA